MNPKLNLVGVILAAGVGSRLRPLTNKKPKCLVKVAGKPIIEYQIEAYRNAGITKLVIVVGYESVAVESFCKHIKDINICIVHNEDYETTNNMYSLYLAREHIKNRSFILSNGDVAIEKNVIKKIIEHKGESAVAIDSSQFNDESMKIELNENNCIADISKKIPETKSDGCSIDFYKFSSGDSVIFIEEVERIIEQEKNLKDWTEVALQRLFNNQNLKFSACDISGLKWVEIDSYEDLATADRVFSFFGDLICQLQTIFLDLDGTIYVGSKPIHGVSDSIRRLIAKGKKIYFFSNNSSKNKHDYVQRLESMGVPITTSQVILSTDAVVEYLKAAKVDQIHVLGTNSLKKIFLDEGFQIDSVSPEYVIIGYDTELNYKKLISACKYINSGTDIIATHCDITCPSEYGPIPDIGALLEMIKLTTGKEPVKIFGKPNSNMVSNFFKKNNIDPASVLFVGDRLHTDIQMAKNIGSYSLLVLTGETTRDQLENSEIWPDCVLNSLAEIEF